jgi:hypothetical protein
VYSIFVGTFLGCFGDLGVYANFASLDIGHVCVVCLLGS